MGQWLTPESPVPGNPFLMIDTEASVFLIGPTIGDALWYAANPFGDPDQMSASTREELRIDREPGAT